MPNQRYGLHHRICKLRYGTHGYGMSAYLWALPLAFLQRFCLQIQNLIYGQGYNLKIQCRFGRRFHFDEKFNA